MISRILQLSRPNENNGSNYVIVFKRDPRLGVGPLGGQGSIVGLTGWPGFWRRAHGKTPIP
jgi:hypothetical protein